MSKFRHTGGCCANTNVIMSKVFDGMDDKVCEYTVNDVVSIQSTVYRLAPDPIPGTAE